MNFEQVRAGLKECMAWVAAAPEEKREQVYLENLSEAVLSAREALDALGDELDPDSREVLFAAVIGYLEAVGIRPTDASIEEHVREVMLKLTMERLRRIGLVQTRWQNGECFARLNAAVVTPDCPGE